MLSTANEVIQMGQQLTKDKIRQALLTVDPETKRLPSGLGAFARAAIAADRKLNQGDPAMPCVAWQVCERADATVVCMDTSQEGAEAWDSKRFFVEPLVRLLDAQAAIDKAQTEAYAEGRADEAKEPICQQCNGSGEETVSTYGEGPNDHDMTIACRQCKGDGRIGIAQAAIAAKDAEIAAMDAEVERLKKDAARWHMWAQAMVEIANDEKSTLVAVMDLMNSPEPTCIADVNAIFDAAIAAMTQEKRS